MTFQRSLIDELDTSEDLLPFVTDIQHDQVIRTQNSVVIQVLKEKIKIKSFIDVYLILIC
jgi:hypothetical protein